MYISYYTVANNLDSTRGYGMAGLKVVTSLEKIGHRIGFDEPSYPVQISFCQPSHYKFNDGQYRIGYTPWESTELPDTWAKKMNNCDEVWATSEWVANVFELNGVKVPIFVYEHGIDPIWTPTKRTPGEVVKFLHIGEPALRKGGQMAMDAFRDVFGDRKDVHLTMKTYHSNFLRSWNDGEHGMPDFNNVTILARLLDHKEMVQLYVDHDVFVYPTYGEGFGFFPLQALGTGMPVISTGEWAPYREFLAPLEIPARWDRSVWSVHPGNVLYPDYEALKRLLAYSYDNISDLHYRFYAQAEEVHATYDWITTTRNMFEKLEKRLTGS